MPRISELQKLLLKKLLSMMLWLPAAWFFYWAIFPLAWSRPFVIYLMLTLKDWLCFILAGIGATLLEMLLNDPKLRAKFRAGLKFQSSRQEKPTLKKSEEKEERLPLV